MFYVEFTEQQDINLGVKEVCSIEEATTRAIDRYESPEEFPQLKEKYLEEYGSEFIEDLDKAKNIDEEYYCDIVKRGLELSGFYITIRKEPETDPDLDQF